MPIEQSHRLAILLACNRTCTIVTSTSLGTGVMPVRYRAQPVVSRASGLRLDCLVPRWSDMAYYLEQSPEVILIVQISRGIGLSWLQVVGSSKNILNPDWSWLLPGWMRADQPDLHYLVVRVFPRRIDLIDEDLGWGVQETMES